MKKGKRTNNGSHNTTLKTEGRATRSEPNTRGELRCSDLGAVPAPNVSSGYTNIELT